MSIYEVITKSGSVYYINTLLKTWKRVKVDHKSGTLRNEDGKFFEVDTTNWQRGMLLTLPPYKMDGPDRLIVTSSIIDITEIV